MNNTIIKNNRLYYQDSAIPRYNPTLQQVADLLDKIAAELMNHSKN